MENLSRQDMRNWGPVHDSEAGIEGLDTSCMLQWTNKGKVSKIKFVVDSTADIQ